MPDKPPVLLIKSDDPAEAAYWEFDARRSGYNQWKGMPMSERDAFKAVVRKLAAETIFRLCGGTDKEIAEAVRREFGIGPVEPVTPVSTRQQALDRMTENANDLGLDY